MGVHTGGGLLGQISVKYYQTYLRFAWVKNLKEKKTYQF